MLKNRAIIVLLTLAQSFSLWAQFSYNLPNPDYLRENGLDIPKNEQFVLSLKSSLNGCAKISWENWDTIVQIEAFKPLRFTPKLAVPDTGVPIVDFYSRYSTLKQQTLEPYRILSSIPLNIAFYRNLSIKKNRYGRSDIFACDPNRSNEAFELRKITKNNSPYLYTDVHSIQHERALTNGNTNTLDFLTRPHYFYEIKSQLISDQVNKVVLLSDTKMFYSIDSLLGTTLLIEDSILLWHRHFERYCTQVSLRSLSTIRNREYFFYLMPSKIALYNIWSASRTKWSWRDNKPLLLDVHYKNKPLKITPEGSAEMCLVISSRGQESRISAWLDSNDYVGNNQYLNAQIGYLEQVLPKDFAANQFLVPQLEQYDSLMLSVLFWENNTQLIVNGQNYGVFDHDTVARLHISQASEIRSNKPIQLQAATFSDTNQLPKRTINYYNPYGAQLHGNYAGVGFRPDAPKDYIRQSVFQAFPTPDSASQAYANFTVQRQNIYSMQLNGKPMNPALFKPYPSNPDFLYTEFALHPDSVYVAFNPGGFLGIHYSKPTVTDAFVPTYAITLSETPLVEDGFSELQYRRLGDTVWTLSDTLYYCPDSKIEIRLPQYRFTTWTLHRNDGTDTIIRVGEDEAAPFLLRTDALQEFHFISVTDSMGCAMSDTLYTVLSELQEPESSAELLASCDGFALQAIADNPNEYELLWTIEGQQSTGDTAIAYLLDLNPTNASVDYQLAVSSPTCEALFEGQWQFENPFESLFPNIFTPNSDGVNDCFTVPSIDNFECIEMQIFNRYGRLLWTGDKDQCWNGQFNGNDLPEGVYFYIYQFGPYSHEGFVHLAR